MLTQTIDSYLAIRRPAGFQLRVAEGLLRSYARFAATRGETHVCKMETPQEAYAMAKKNNGAPGLDGVAFEDIEALGAQQYIAQIRDELIERTYVPMRSRKKEIPNDGAAKSAFSRFLPSATAWYRGRSS